ncbi:hypothetical protein V6N13_016504 [Hibiscus sabdariffa]
MYSQMVQGTTTTTLFHGKEYRMCYSPDPGAGIIENGIHISLHKWVGDPNQPLKEDLGNFYSAGYDPLFYAHHANIDRMWNLWKTKLPLPHCDFKDTDWLGSSFLFYDENANLVRARVGDCIDTKTLGYDYKDVDLKWLENECGSTRKTIGKAKNPLPATRNAFPLVLDKLVRVDVPVTKKSRNVVGEEDDGEQVVILQDIQLERDSSVKFDVCINVTDDKKTIGPGHPEFVGSFTNIPHGHHHHGSKLNTQLSLSISNAFKGLQLEDEAKVVVTLVPKEGEGLVSVGNIKMDHIRD